MLFLFLLQGVKYTQYHDQMCLPYTQTHLTPLWKDAKNYNFTWTALDNLFNMFQIVGNAVPLKYFKLQAGDSYTAAQAPQAAQLLALDTF